MTDADPIAWFKVLTGNEPYRWQEQLLANKALESRLIRIPTGFGKTLGVLAGWTWHRVVQKDARWLDQWIDAQPRGGDGGGRGE